VGFTIEPLHRTRGSRSAAPRAPPLVAISNLSGGAHRRRGPRHPCRGYCGSIRRRIGYSTRTRPNPRLDKAGGLGPPLPAEP
jgi:hypothetical protein